MSNNEQQNSNELTTKQLKKIFLQKNRSSVFTSSSTTCSIPTLNIFSPPTGTSYCYGGHPYPQFSGTDTQEVLLSWTYQKDGYYTQMAKLSFSFCRMARLWTSRKGVIFGILCIILFSFYISDIFARPSDSGGIFWIYIYKTRERETHLLCVLSRTPPVSYS